MKTSPIPVGFAVTDPISRSSTALRVIATIARLLLGISLVIFGLNGFLNFIPQPEKPLPADAMAFVGALVNSGYMMQLIAVTHLVVGVLLLLNRYVPLALVLFAPFIVNSIAFHAVLEPSGLPIAGVFLALELYLAWHHRAAFRPLFVAKLPT